MGSVLYRTIRRLIEMGNTDGLADRIDVLFAAGKLSEDEYNELVGMLKE